MSKLEMSILAVLLSLLLASLAQSAAIQDSNVSSRSKRQSADVRTAEYLAWIALGGKVPGGHGCDQVACGVVDVYRSGKKKRGSDYSSSVEEERYNLLRALVERAAIENAAV